jgi:hypothetical protein
MVAGVRWDVGNEVTKVVDKARGKLVYGIAREELGREDRVAARARCPKLRMGVMVRGLGRGGAWYCACAFGMKKVELSWWRVSGVSVCGEGQKCAR